VPSHRPLPCPPQLTHSASREPREAKFTNWLQACQVPCGRQEPIGGTHYCCRTRFRTGKTGRTPHSTGSRRSHPGLPFVGPAGPGACPVCRAASSAARSSRAAVLRPRPLTLCRISKSCTALPRQRCAPGAGVHRTMHQLTQSGGARVGYGGEPSPLGQGGAHPWLQPTHLTFRVRIGVRWSGNSEHRDARRCGLWERAASSVHAR
jgi:hypothetical protein